MAQKFDYLKSEAELRKTLDELYNIAKTALEEGNRPSIRGLVEIISSEATIVTAIHNIKSNKGSKTPGIDSKTMQKDYLEKPYNWVIADIQSAFAKFTPQKKSDANTLRNQGKRKNDHWVSPPLGTGLYKNA